MIWPQGPNVLSDIGQLLATAPHDNWVVHRLPMPWKFIGVMIRSCVYWETNFGPLSSGRFEGPKMYALMGLMRDLYALGTEELVLLVGTRLSFTPQGYW